MEATHQPLRLDKRSLVQLEIIDISTILIIISFNGAFEYGDVYFQTSEVDSKSVPVNMGK
jgi:hypothetical protein